MAEPKLMLLDEPGAGVNPALLDHDRRQGGGAQPPGHQLPDHRAQHGPGDVAVPPGDGDGAGPAAGQRRARPRCCATRAWSRPISAERGMSAPALGVVPSLDSRLRARPADRARRLARRRRRRDRRHHRAQRRRQVDAWSRPWPGWCRSAPAACMLRRRDITRVPAHEMVHQGLAFVPQTENVFADLTIAENLELAGQRCSKARAGSARAWPSDVRAVPRPGAPAHAARRPAVGRPAPDAGGGARADRRARAC